ncbi:WD domain-containing protein [Dimargaris cristalligena]|uniref:WD domain-containing protein n=1 Tax=Dimargaris cristalligena TaxID=215637 RepID=A0A4P9ZRH4_9FUNG|nr:WD domain-containing protein [Dimargaris cristalligena]|eukprot:RKP35252.1 WD domain-containing protein [Dimargaris cristalligena]
MSQQRQRASPENPPETDLGAKKAKAEHVPPRQLVTFQSTAVVQRSQPSESAWSLTRIERCPSSLSAPLLQLTGHEGEVLTCQFDPTGQLIASGSADRHIFLWRTAGDCPNYGMLKAHRGAVTQIRWTSQGTQLYSTASDKTAILWDCESGQPIRRWKGHTAAVNCCSVPRGFTGSGLLATGSDDGTVRQWDPRQRHATHILPRKWPVTALAHNSSGDQLFVGSLDNTIAVWDLRKQASLESLLGHTDTVTGLDLHPEGSHLLSYAMDNTARIWDVRPFVPSDRAIHTLTGAPAGFEKNLIKPAWSPDGSTVATGSGDRSVTLWNARTATLLAKLPGHKGCVNQVHFHPREAILLSGSTDRTLLLGDLDVDL